MAGRVLALVHREGLLLWVQEVAHVLVGGLDAVGGDLGSGVGGEGVVGGDHGCPPFFVGLGGVGLVCLLCCGPALLRYPTHAGILR